MNQIKFNFLLTNAFTDQGIAMLSAVLNSHRSVQVNVDDYAGMRTIKKMLSSHADLTHKLAAREISALYRRRGSIRC